MSALVPMSVLLTEARRAKYALPAFNVDSFDMLLAVVAAAQEAGSPLIVQLTEPAAQFLGVGNAVAIARHEGARTGVQVALHLDHATNLSMIEECLASGFTSAMIDGSTLDWSANVEITRAAVAIARRFGASIEAEVGHVGTSGRGPAVDLEGGGVAEHDITVLTRPEDAARFFQETCVDALAVSVGSTHGLASRTKSLDFERLAAISALVSIPLVLHGSSGVRETELARAPLFGIGKVNVETELRIAFRKSLEQVLGDDPANIKPRLLMGAVREAVKRRALGQLHLLGCVGRASGEKQLIPVSRVTDNVDHLSEVTPLTHSRST